ncbi:hypothetical protein CDL12_16716 [Handroanthus impetiginosus]|uniref:Uncharacterized protein n=1 Tax=Handroanthus impetiginosus TaxID=429701 RepID=A0A2G9GZP3_9LAMI|nr:hypothetical protein CDL12_16716 [Handroanthus impetiginosus]
MFNTGPHLVVEISPSDLTVLRDKYLMLILAIKGQLYEFFSRPILPHRTRTCENFMVHYCHNQFPVLFVSPMSLLLWFLLTWTLCHQNLYFGPLDARI